MHCHSLSVSTPCRLLNFEMLWALKLLVVGVICLDCSLVLASLIVVDLCGRTIRDVR
jgi:hypothetical protein